MDNRDYDEEFDDEEIDDQFDDPLAYDGIEDNETPNFYSQNLNSQIRDVRRKNKKDQSTISKLRQRKSNTMSKGVEAKNSTPSSSENDESEEPETNEKKNQGIGNKIQEVAKNAANQAKEKVKTAAKETVKKVAAKIVMHPYFWIFVGVLVLIMMIPILWGAYDSDGGSSSGNNGSISYIEGYEECDSIIVDGYGTFSLDDYVAGVISHESYADESIEALKAQAITARTYAIYHTNNCTTSIGNSQASQTFYANPNDVSKQAATETSGQVLTYNGEIFQSMYDSFCYADSDCPDATKHEDGTYTVTYTKLPNKEKHVLTLKQEKQYKRIVPGGGHAHGMSQLVSYQLASEGKKYDEILEYFYSPGVEISSITKSNASLLLGDFNGKFNIRTTKPNWLSAPDSNYYLKQGSNNFQCVWYARYRVNEILSTMTGDVDDTKREKAKTTLLAAAANGSGWYDIAQNGGTMSIFESSNDYMKPRPGALVSYKWNSAGCINYHGVNCDANNYNYGHVAVIESVDYENQKVVVTDGWMQCENWNNTSCLGFQHKELTFEQMQNFGTGRYIFLGYVYVADYALNSTISTTDNSDISINANNSGSASNGKANTCSNGKVDSTQPDPAIAVNYWQSQGTISASNFIYPTDKKTGYKLGAHPKNFNYSNLANPTSYHKELIWPVTPSNGKYHFGYEHNGIDVSAHFGTPIYALGDGKLVYSEWGHTVNKGCDETAYSVTMELNNPIKINGKKVKTIFITHMSGIVYYCPLGNCNKTVKKGELLGFIGHASGTASSTGTWAPHLHMSLYDDVYDAGFKTSEIESIYNLSSGKDIVAGG